MVSGFNPQTTAVCSARSVVNSERAYSLYQIYRIELNESKGLDERLSLVTLVYLYIYIYIDEPVRERILTDW